MEGIGHPLVSARKVGPGFGGLRTGGDGHHA